MPPGGVCKDCKSRTRPASYPGPRCYTCWNKEKKRRKEAAHGSYVEKTYGISAEEYEALYKAQGGHCAICERSTGRTRRLAVDHNHKTGEVRGLLCKPCNSYGIGMFARDNPEILDRAADYLRNPPADKVLRSLRCQGQPGIKSS